MNKKERVMKEFQNGFYYSSGSRPWDTGEMGGGGGGRTVIYDFK